MAKIVFPVKVEQEIKDKLQKAAALKGISTNNFSEQALEKAADKVIKAGSSLHTIIA